MRLSDDGLMVRAAALGYPPGWTLMMIATDRLRLERRLAVPNRVSRQQRRRAARDEAKSSRPGVGVGSKLHRAGGREPQRIAPADFSQGCLG